MGQIIVLLILTVLLVIIIVGVFMEQALVDLKTATDALTLKVASLPTQADHTAEVQAATVAVTAATDALNQKFPG